jgi:Group II intron, maturase-specific domain
VIAVINPILRGWVNYFRVGNAARCFSIQTLAPDRADEPLREGILPRAGGRGQDFGDPQERESWRLPPGLTFRLWSVEMPTTTQPRDPECQGGAMPTVRLRKVSEYPESAQMLFELSKAWFNHDFPAPPAMSRVMAWDPDFGGPHGRAMKRAMAPGEFTRAQKEMVAAVVSGMNACPY